MIDFESKFRLYLHEYAKAYDDEDQELEEKAPDIYFEWQNTPKDWLQGKSPAEYFVEFDAPTLVEMLGRYIISGFSVPNVLLNRTADIKQETYPYLLSLLKNYEGEKAVEIKSAIVRLIEEMDMPHHLEYYIESISDAEEKNDFVECAAEELKGSGSSCIDKLTQAYENARNPYVSDCFLDILCDVSFEKRIFDFALDKFLYSSGNRAFYASCLGKLSDADALPYLYESLSEENLGFYDYTAIKNAIEALGGEVEIDREFDGDSDYESLMKWRNHEPDQL